MCQNAEHSLSTALLEVLPAMQAFLGSILYGTPRPSFEWKISETSGAITVTNNDTILKPSKVIMHYATTLDNKTRDFRLVTAPPPAKCHGVVLKGECIHPVLWYGKELTPSASLASSSGESKYIATRDPPANGAWTAFFVELQYPGFHNTTFHTTSEVSIVPFTYPFPPCHGAGCNLTIV